MPYLKVYRVKFKVGFEGIHWIVYNSDDLYWDGILGTSICMGTDNIIMQRGVNDIMMR